MNLDFAQVLTQIFAFVIVFWILRRFGWSPLLAVMEERKRLIQSQFEEIEKEKETLQKMKDDYSNKLAEIDSLSRQEIQKAIKDGRQIAEDIQNSTKAQAKELIQKAKEEVNRQMQEAKNDLKKQMITIAFSVAQKILSEEISEDKKKKFISDFVDHMELK